MRRPDEGFPLYPRGDPGRTLVTMTDDAVFARLDRLESDNARLADRLEVVEAENHRLRAATTALPAPPAASVPEPDEAPGPGATALGRRQALRKGLAVAGVAAAGAVLLDGRPAAAANNDPLICGQVNSATSTTQLNGIFYNSVSNGIATYSLSSGGIGSYQQGSKANLWFADTNTRNAPTGDNFAHARGEVVFDKFGTLWLCVVGGTPGTWRTMSGNGSAGNFYPFPSPQRTYDSRPGTTPSQGPKTKLGAGVTRIISLSNVGATSQPPAGVSLSILLVNAAAGNGNFTVWGADLPIPQANTLVWGGSAGRFTTMAFSTLDEAGRINVRASLATDVVIDVVGFYR